MDARGAPGGILGHHAKDKLAQFFADADSSQASTMTGEPGPVQTKPGAMPAHDGFWHGYHQRLLPAGPPPSNKNPEQLVGGPQSRFGVASLQNYELLSKEKVFQHQITPGAEESWEGTKKQPEEAEHGKNL